MMDPKINYSEDVLVMINKIPSKVVFFGTVIIVLNILILFLFPYYIKYPQVITHPIDSNNAHWVSESTDILAHKTNGIADKLLYLKIKDVSQLKKGNEVNIRFSNINPIKKGVLQGKICDILQDSTGSWYFVVISLPSEFKTTYNFAIPEDIDINGFCDFITLNTRFLSRLFHNSTRNASNILKTTGSDKLLQE